MEKKSLALNFFLINLKDRIKFGLFFIVQKIKFFYSSRFIDRPISAIQFTFHFITFHLAYRQAGFQNSGVLSFALESFNKFLIIGLLD